MISVLCLNREEYERSLEKNIAQCLKNNFGKYKIKNDLCFYEVSEYDYAIKAKKRILTYSDQERKYSLVRNNLYANIDISGAIF